MRRFEDAVSRLFAERFGTPPAEVHPIAADGSARRRIRLVGPDGRTAIGGQGADKEENIAFFSFARSFSELGLPVPEIYASDEALGVWLEEDLGDDTLFDTLRSARQEEGAGGFPDTIIPLYRRVVEILPRFQLEGAAAIDFGLAYPRAAFDRQSILWDLNYFKYHFLKLARIPFHEARLERDFGRLCRFLLKADTGYFLYRDFQSRNVMIRGGEPWFIDFQGGRKGALQYDVGSLLYDAKADLPAPLRAELLQHYLDALASHREVDRARFLERYPAYVLVRILQALGAYGYRGFYERKPRFLQSVPLAARNIEELLEPRFPIRAPELEGVLRRILDRWAGPSVTPEEGSVLTIQVGSFRYGGGYPEDTTGHGGGHVFDCRGLPNPGRAPEYRHLTGLDDEVIRFMEGRTETDAFWERVRDLTDAQVREYLRRGFHGFSVNFGCTGGQHRSVYFAERLSRHLEREHEGIRILLTHRERADWPSRPASIPG